MKKSVFLVEVGAQGVEGGSRLGAVTPEAAELVIGVVGTLKVVEAEGGAACPESRRCRWLWSS